MSETKPIVWSHSSLKTFQQCPRKYYHLKVAKDVVDKPHESALYGSSVHKAAEDHLRDGVPIPPVYAYMQPILDVLKAIPGEKFCELKMGLTQDLRTCDFDAPDVWWHGIVDLLVVNRAAGAAHMVDYKTGKSARYADQTQLDYMAAAVFAQFPEVQTIKSALIFVVSNELVQKVHVRGKMDYYISSARPHLQRLEAAFATGVWNPKSSGLCPYCPVKTCEYHP